MGRRFIDYDEAIIKEGSAYTVNVEFYTGEKYENLEVRSLFPVSSPRKFISLCEGTKEIAVVRNLDQIIPESAKALEKVLENYYMIPKIISVIDRSDKYGVLKWTVETDKGIRSFEIKNRNHDIRVVYLTRVLIRDSNDNRYEIPNFEELDYKSLKKIYNDL